MARERSIRFSRTFGVWGGCLKIEMQDRFRGCLIGGSLGDALGYPIEFMSLSEIKKKYGEAGLQELVADDVSGKALISDDTQMSLFTASGLLLAKHRMESRGLGGWIESGIYPSYKRWVCVQSGFEIVDALAALPYELDGTIPNILTVRELYASREPGRTCFRTLYQGECGTIDKPINNSKGCGGVMRVAPIGLFLHHDPMRAAAVAADAAAVTHGHPSGYIPAALLAFIIACLINGADLLDALYDGLAYIRRWKGFEETTAAVRLTIEYFDADLPTDAAISEIGEGWVAEEALAIALYCALKEPEPVRALRLSVNHDGDSDSTGAICGNLLGAMYGMSAFPREWIAKLEIAAFIAEMGDALYRAVSGAEATL